MVVGVGGPVEPARGWVIHDRAQWDPHATSILTSMSLTTTLDGVVREGHERFGDDGGRFLFLLGYSGWGAGQIEEEIAAGSWVVVPVRGPSDGVDQPGVREDFVLDTAPENMWTDALKSLGIDPVRLVGLNRSVGLH
ncbi:MAG: YqgE/AlgH family protein, partial [Nannocystaceae bacterium]